jgi:hypothetical protein
MVSVPVKSQFLQNQNQKTFFFTILTTQQTNMQQTSSLVIILLFVLTTYVVMPTEAQDNPTFDLSGQCTSHLRNLNTPFSCTTYCSSSAPAGTASIVDYAQCLCDIDQMSVTACVDAIQAITFICEYLSYPTPYVMNCPTGDQYAWSKYCSSCLENHYESYPVALYYVLLVLSGLLVLFSLLICVIKIRPHCIFAQHEPANVYCHYNHSNQQTVATDEHIPLVKRVN